MTDILSRIHDCRTKYICERKPLVKEEPNVLYLNMADYRAFKEAIAELSNRVILKPRGQGVSTSFLTMKDEVCLGMEVRKRAGGMKCAYEEIAGSARKGFIMQE